jgi:archaellum component FlaC
MRKIIITLFLTLSFSVWAVEDHSKDNKNQVESLEDSINKLSDEIKKLSASLKPVNSAFTPKIKRIFIEYGRAKGEINDLANDFLGSMQN